MRPALLHGLFAPVSRLMGVGPQLAQAIARLIPPPEGQDAPLVRDLLFLLPSGLIDRRATFPLRETPDGITATFVVRVEGHHPPPPRSRKPYKVVCGNDTGTLTLVFFHVTGDYLLRSLPVGEQRVVSGRVEHFDMRTQMTHPDIIAPLSQLAAVQRIEPVYPLTAGITNRQLAAFIQRGLSEVPPLAEWIDAETLARHGWRDFKQTLTQAHAPQGEADLQPQSPVRMRLAYDEALSVQLHLALLRARRQEKPGRSLRSAGALRDAVRERLPFSLTDGQRQALSQIDADMASGRRMARILQGDVGSGKTLVALLAALTVAEEGAQAAILAPTELIAQQHYDTFTRWCNGLKLNIVLLTGAVRGAARAERLEALAGGQAQIAIGTHALLQEHVAFADLALIVVDEQQRFGVAQRMAMNAKGDAPHLLQMTATPIPRTLSMTLYGDMDITLITDKPPGRRPITTRTVPAGRAEELTDRLAQALARGEKAYWICPLIEDGDVLAATDVAAAEARFSTFRALFGEQVALVHGRMKAPARHEALRQFASGGARLLVATTVVEVGVDVPDATIIIIEQAERFGLSQLHQLRGRVGRADKASACVLLYSDNAVETARARLSAVRDTEDGFAIAEADLAIRGSGELLGTRQSGLPRFRFIDLALHQKLIAEARADAIAMLKQDPALASPRGQALKMLLALYGYTHDF